MHDPQVIPRTLPRRRALDWMTRCGDIGVAAELLALTSPLMVIVAAAIKLESPGPILERHTCIGIRGRRFQMLKFRTAPHHPLLLMQPAWQHRSALVGQFVSFSRIEALPQIFNVLRGDVSILDRNGRSPSFLD